MDSNIENSFDICEKTFLEYQELGKHAKEMDTEKNVLGLFLVLSFLSQRLSYACFISSFCPHFSFLWSLHSSLVFFNATNRVAMQMSAVVTNQAEG